MMTWNYRLTKVVHDNEVQLDFREVYYKGGDTDEFICAWTVDAIGAHGETIDEVRFALKHMMKALDKPILDLAELAQRLGFQDV